VRRASRASLVDVQTKRAAALAAVLLAGAVAGCGSAPPRHAAAELRQPSPPSAAAPAPSRPRYARPDARRAVAARHVPTAVTHQRATRPSTALPLHLPTGDAQQVITAVAPSTTSTQGILQAWRRAGRGWRPVGGPTPAWFGSAGLSAQPSESLSATPIGSFTLTRAFGRDPNPGTGLPYVQTTPDDWWISQPGGRYNTLQRCAADCPFTQGSPNEHLYDEVPYYDYAVVIDYNTRNAPGGVRQGAGSAFFLHVTVGEPTQGCISIAQARLVGLLRWLTPARHPRILIGTS
jgi:L,D-peptidoglycan transpeptidase YkuD (ErfK/YbiS/YcfS/YnhG family)